MIRELFYKLHSTLRSFNGDGNVAVLFIAAVLVLVFLNAGKKNRYKRSFAAISPLGVIGLAVSEVIDRVKDGEYKSRFLKVAAVAFAAALSILTITASGRRVFSKDFCERAENGMHIPQYLIDAVSTMPEEDNTYVLLPYDWAPYLDAYSSRFTLPTDVLEGSDESVIRAELNDIHPDMKKVTQIAHSKGFSYVILPTDVWPDVPITKCGYELILENDGCRLYREVKYP